VAARPRGQGLQDVLGCPGLTPGHDGTWSEKQREQVVPLWIFALDESDFPVALILLQLLFAADSVDDEVARFVPDEPTQAIALREAIECAAPMLRGPRYQVAGHTNVERAMTAISHHVDCDERFPPNHRTILSTPPHHVKLAPLISQCLRRAGHSTTTRRSPRCPSRPATRRPISTCRRRMGGCRLGG